MSSTVESRYAGPTALPQAGGRRNQWVRFVAASWGFCAFFPVGLMYLHLLVLLSVMAIAPHPAARWQRLRASPLLLPLLLMLGWTVLAALVGGMFPETPTRIFHTVRVVLVIALALMLSRCEARHALGGFLAGALLACALVAANRLWGLPDWPIWSSLITPRNNFSSGNMITLALAAGTFFCLALDAKARPAMRRLAVAGLTAAGVTVVLHAVSRNAQVLLAVVAMTAVVYRFRSLRAVIAGAVTVLLLVAAAWQFSPTIQSRFAEVTSNLHAVEAKAMYNSSIGVRWRMYQEAYGEMARHPLLGTGVGSWSPYWKAVWASLDQELSPEEFRRFAEINNPHNDYLLAGMETGVPGLLLLVWVFVQFMVTGWRRRSTAGAITVMMALALAATAMVNAPLRDAALGMTLLWLLGASVAAQRESAHA